MKPKQSVLLFLLLIFFLCGFAQVPSLKSNPGGITVYLDFDGEYVTGTSWNWYGPINAKSSNLSVEAITEIFNRVSEDYRIFEINITTDSTVYYSSPADQRIRIIITPTYSWYGAAGGVAFVGSFNWGDDTPAWVFSGLLANNPKYVAEAASHEIGHTLGLHHQSSYDQNCMKTAEYAGGQGTGEIGWAPIMGVGYYKNLTTWHNGPNAISCTSLQSDIDQITSIGIPLRSDDYPNTHLNASDLQINGKIFTATGLINAANDKDVFQLNLEAESIFRLTANPQHVGSGNSGANIDIRVTLLDHLGDTIGRYNPTDLLDAGVDTNLSAGKYYLVSEGVENVNLRDYGSLGYYSISGSLETDFPIRQFRLNGIAANNTHSLSWNFITNESVREIELQVSANGKQFEKLVTLDQSARSLSYQTLSEKLYYRTKAILNSDGRSYYSNIIELSQGKRNRPIQLLSNLVNGKIMVNCTGSYSYRLLSNGGQQLLSGNIRAGLNILQLPATSKGLVLLQVHDGKNSWIEKVFIQ